VQNAGGKITERNKFKEMFVYRLVHRLSGTASGTLTCIDASRVGVGQGVGWGECSVVKQ
jgi:hypothetical protein